MDRLWIYAVLLAGVCVLTKVRSEDVLPDLDNNYEDLVALSNEEIEGQEDEEVDSNFDDEMDDMVEKELERYRIDEQFQAMPPIEDYQFEDNRSEVKDEHTENDNDEHSPNENKSQFEEIAVDYAAVLPESDTDNSKEQEQIEEQESKKLTFEEDTNNEKDDLNGEAEQQNSDANDNLTVDEENQKEPEDIDESNNWSLEEDIKTAEFSEEKNRKDLQDIIEETKQLLEDTDNNFEDVNPENLDEDKDQEIVENDKPDDVASEIDDDEESVGKIYADLSDDLERLSEIWRKLREEEEDNDNSEENSEQIDILAYEEKFDRPFKEDAILKTRKDYDALYDLFDGTESDEDSGLESEEENLRDENEAPAETSIEKKIEMKDESQDILQGNGEFRDDDDENVERTFGNNQTKSSDNDDVKSYGDDAWKANDDMPDEDEETLAKPIKTVDVDELSSTEYDDLMRNFKTVHSDVLDPESEDFTRHVAPIHISLSVDEATIVTSPNYPRPYTPNNVIDWIFDGQGRGIDLRIHDFAVNGVLGDYLLVKPGGEDATGTDGLIFSYSLSSERRYAFLDVDRMFVRFEARPALAFMRGFNFTVRMIAPLADKEEDLPEAEPVIQFPESTLTVILGGVSMFEFEEIREDFRQIIADMATMYINANGLDHGRNTTMETAQITNTSVCNINWPNFEHCVEVRFGVPLVYDEEQESRLNEADLKAMWYTYIYQDPFALRLNRMGIKEFAIPNDGAVMMVWLVIAGGVVISMAMLAFALWKYTCFEDYTRMPSFSDTDSLKNEKRGLDLYPTPHQTLPPLYESEYKYDHSYRVDVGGYPNKSYVREDLFDIDSDEDTLPRRDRKGSYSPRRFSDV